jgi:exonuclease VII small subunit
MANKKKKRTAAMKVSDQSGNKIDKQLIKTLRDAISAVSKARAELASEEQRTSDLESDVNMGGRENIDRYVKAKAQLEFQPTVMEEAEANLQAAEQQLRLILKRVEDEVRQVATETAARLIAKIAKVIRPFCKHILEAQRLANDTYAVQRLDKAQFDLFSGDDSLEIGQRALNFLLHPEAFSLRSAGNAA